MKTSTVVTISVIVFLIYNEIQKNSEPNIYIRKKLRNNYNARTIPPFGIFIKEEHKDNEELLQHELIHWKQYQKKGLINFYLDYYQQYNDFGYDLMPMEIEARFNESDYCKINYTECVRTGKSNTISNKDFRL